MVKWPNHADIDFGNLFPRLDSRTLHVYLRTLKVPHEDVLGFQAVFENNNQILRIEFRELAKLHAFLGQFGGLKTVTLEDRGEKRDVRILIKATNVEEKFVRVTGVPHSMDLRIIERRLKNFGNVLDMRWERFRNDVDEVYYPVLSTWLICRMTLETAIPSYLTIGEYRAIVRYNGQKQTCRLCDEPDHMGKDCPTLRRNRVPEPQPVPKVPAVAKPGPRESAGKAQEKSKSSKIPVAKATETSVHENEPQVPAVSTAGDENMDVEESTSVTIEQQPQISLVQSPILPSSEVQIIPETPTNVIADGEVSQETTPPVPIPPPPPDISVPISQATSTTLTASLPNSPTTARKTKQANELTKQRLEFPLTRQTGNKTSQSASSAEPPNKKPFK